MKKQQKTFAERAKAIKKRYPRADWDAIERKDMLKELRALKEEQEQVRGLMEVADKAEQPQAPQQQMQMPQGQMPQMAGGGFGLDGSRGTFVPQQWSYANSYANPGFMPGRENTNPVHNQIWTQDVRSQPTKRVWQDSLTSESIFGNPSGQQGQGIRPYRGAQNVQQDGMAVPPSGLNMSGPEPYVAPNYDLQFQTPGTQSTGSNMTLPTGSAGPASGGAPSAPAAGNPLAGEGYPAGWYTETTQRGTGSSGGNGMPQQSKADGFRLAMMKMGNNMPPHKGVEVNPALMKNLSVTGNNGLAAAPKQYQTPGTPGLPFALSAASSLMGDVSQMIAAKNLPKSVNLPAPVASTIDLEPQRQAYRRDFGQARNVAMRNARDMGPAQAYANYTAANTGLMDSYGTAMNQSYMNEQNANAALAQEANMQGSQIKSQEALQNAQLQQQNVATRMGLMNSMFETGPRAMADWRAQSNQQQTLNMLGLDKGMYQKILSENPKFGEWLKYQMGADQRFILPRETPSIKP